MVANIFFFNDTATTEIYTLSLHDALPIFRQPGRAVLGVAGIAATGALLFDMLLLSSGLVVSMRGLLGQVGYDVRVTATQATPLAGPRITGADAAVAAIAALPEGEEATAVRVG